MRLHILGICGTFMAGIALLAKQMQLEISGSDANIYPPMSNHLAENGITVFEGYTVKQLSPHPDLVIMGNAMTRGNPCVEYVLNENIPYVSGPMWLAENILKNRHVLAVAGTHGKTTVSSLLSWILEYAGLNPGFLIGGIPKNFNISARLGSQDFFVIEADEYDTAFFDKRSKFIHYHPRTLILNNLEFDHADIFPDLDAIKIQFAYLLRTIPSQGLIICPKKDKNLSAVLARGCWTPIEYTGDQKDYPAQVWQTKLLKIDASQFAVYYKNVKQGEVSWTLLGDHNAANAINAIAAAHHIGVNPILAIEALNQFRGVKRRLEIFKQINGITLYDDFAHHPTAIASTLSGLRKQVGKKRILVILESATHTMRSGIHKETLGPSLNDGDKVWLMRPKPDWGVERLVQTASIPIFICDTVVDIINSVVKEARSSDHIVIMSNSGFDNIHKKLAHALENRG